MDAPSELDAMQYHLLVAEFDLLWSRPAHAGQRERMDRMMRMIEAFERGHQPTEPQDELRRCA